MAKKSAIYSALLTAAILLSFPFFSSAQTLPSALSHLIAPLDIPLILSGNFGEFRGSHFHTGIDIKTQGREGFPVLAAANGEVGRLKVSPWGYGNALYLQHPDGSMTVYAHLQKFAPEIEIWLTTQQYKGRTFGIDMKPAEVFEFAAGDTIGWSGNSGSSGGPHLHFEVRDAQQHPVNPLLWDLPVADKRPPEVGKLLAVPVDVHGFEIRSQAVHVSAGDTASLPLGPVHLGVAAFDRLDAASNVCGVYRIEVEVDGELHFRCTIDTLDFAVNKDMNAHAYYPLWKSSRKSIHRFNVLPGDRLPIYDLAPTDPLELQLDSVYTISVTCWDIHGNKSSNNYSVRGSEAVDLPAESLDSTCSYSPATPSASVTIKRGGVEVVWAKKSFYSREEASLCVYDSVEFAVGPFDAPLAKAFEVSITLPDTTFEDLWMAQSVNDKGIASGGIVCEFSDGRLTFSTRTMGRFRLTRDTIPPRLLPKHSGTPVVKNGDLIFHVEDALSGVAEVSATMDGEWILLRWDPKKKSAIYLASDAIHLPGSLVHVVITSTDGVGLESQWSGYVQMKD
jgi:hypothetical protein